MPLDPQFSPDVHLNLNVRGLGQSATLRINELSRAQQATGREVFRLGLGQSPFPVPRAVAQALCDHAHEKDYLPVKGLLALRQSICDFFQRTEGLEYDPDHILVGPGTKELMFLVQLSYYGDLVIPSPSWVSYAPQAHIIGRHLRWLPTSIESELGVTPQSLEQLCRSDPKRPRLLILNYPGNPTGTAYEPEQLHAIADVARLYKVLILSDEIYSGLHFKGEHVSIARYYPEGTIVSNGLSKWCGAGGWRLGAFAFPHTLGWLVEAMAAVASETFTSTSAPIQYAAVIGYQDSPEMQAYLRASRRILQSLSEFSVQSMRHAGAEVGQPKGAFYIFPSFEALRPQLEAKGIFDSMTLTERLLNETGVAILPGRDFGRPEREFSVRIALVDFDGAAALDALADLGEDDDVPESFLRQHCGRITEAMDRLGNWLNAT